MKSSPFPLKIAIFAIGLSANFDIASAATTIQSIDFAFIPNGQQTLTFNKFDDMGGTRILNAVFAEVTLTKQNGRYEADNDSAVAGDVTLKHTVSASLTVSLTNGLLDSAFSPIGGPGKLEAVSQALTNLGVTSGDPTGTFNAQPGNDDYFLFEPVDVSISDSGQIGDMFKSVYVGNPGSTTFTSTIGANQLVSLTGLGGVQQAFTVSNVLGNVKFTYDYTAIPEPSTSLTILGFAAFSFLRRRRS